MSRMTEAFIFLTNICLSILIKIFFLLIWMSIIKSKWHQTQVTGIQVRYSANKSATTTLQGSNFLKRFPDFGSSLPTPKIPLRCSKNSRTTNPIKFRTTLTTTEPMLTKMPSSESRYSYARLQTVPRPGISGMPELNDSKVRPRPSVQGFESLLSNQ